MRKAGDGAAALCADGAVFGAVAGADAAAGDVDACFPAYAGGWLGEF